MPAPVFSQSIPSQPASLPSASAQQTIDPLQATVFFPLIVDSDLSLTAQSLLRRECGASIGQLKLEPLPRHHQVRIWVYLAAAAYTVALHAIVLGLPVAEVGSVNYAPVIQPTVQPLAA
jgi:hypothetical protein